MVELPTKHPGIAKEFSNGSFTVKKPAGFSLPLLKPEAAKNFADYATNIFIPYVDSQLRNVSRVDLVWDVYIEDSLKNATREKHGKGVRRHM